MSLHYEIDAEEPFDPLSLQILDMLLRDGKLLRDVFVQRVTAIMSKILQVVTIKNMKPRVILQYESQTVVACYASLYELKLHWPTIEHAKSDFCSIWFRCSDKTHILSLNAFQTLCKPELYKHIRFQKTSPIAHRQKTIARIQRRNTLHRLCQP